MSDLRMWLGALVGIGSGFILWRVNVPFLLLLLAPFISGFVAGSPNSGVKAGALTLALALLMVGLVFIGTEPGASVSEKLNVTGIGAAYSTFTSLTNGLLGSLYGTTGMATLSSQLGLIFLVFNLVSVLAIAGISFTISAIIGAAGGLLGSIISNLVE